MRKSILVVPALSAALVIASCSSFLDATKATSDPNNPTIASINQLFVGAQAVMFGQQEGAPAMADLHVDAAVCRRQRPFRRAVRHVHREQRQLRRRICQPLSPPAGCLAFATYKPKRPLLVTSSIVVSPKCSRR